MATENQGELANPGLLGTCPLKWCLHVCMYIELSFISHLRLDSRIAEYQFKNTITKQVQIKTVITIITQCIIQKNIDTARGIACFYAVI